MTHYWSQGIMQKQKYGSEHPTPSVSRRQHCLQGKRRVLSCFSASCEFLVQLDLRNWIERLWIITNKWISDLKVFAHIFLQYLVWKLDERRSLLSHIVLYSTWDVSGFQALRTDDGFWIRLTLLFSLLITYKSGL